MKIDNGQDLSKLSLEELTDLEQNMDKMENPYAYQLVLSEIKKIKKNKPRTPQDNSDIINVTQQSESKPKRIPLYFWLISWLIAFFYLASSAGWYCATYMIRTGILGDESQNIWANLTLVDHIIQNGTVILSIIGSIMLVIMNKWSYKIFSIVLLLTVIAIIVNGIWVISYLSPVMLIPVWLYLFFLNRFSYLRTKTLKAKPQRPDTVNL